MTGSARRWVAALALLLLVASIATVLATRGGDGHDMDEVRYTDGSSTEKPEVARSAQRITASSAELRTLLQSRGELKAGRANELHGQIEAAAGELSDQFDRDRDKLRDLGADRALDRLDTIEKRTEDALKALDDALGDEPDARAALTALDGLTARPDEPATSTELPLRTDNARPGAPSLGAAIAPAYQAPNASIEPSSLPREPSDEDRAAAPEGRLNGAVDALASELDDDPIQIYEWVRNEIRFEPYLGIRKGAAGTLSERSGNDADQAALLVALLRAADVPARYVHGTARLPVDQAANWLGLDTGAGDKASVAADILASAGVPARAIAANNVVRYVDFEHVWVEAHVAQSAYRGVEEGTGAKSWAPLDPSIKPNRFKRRLTMPDAFSPIVDELMGGIADSFEVADDHSAVFQPPEQLQPLVATATSQAKAAFMQRAGDDISIGSIIGSHSVEREELGYLPASLPFAEREVDAEWRAVPDELVAKMSVEVAGSDFDAGRAANTDAEPSITWSATTWELLGKRLTLGYAPATADDAEIIDAYHGLLSTPAYAAELVPVLRVDGNVVARGARVPAAWFQGLTVTYDEPAQRPARVTNPVQVGAISAIVADPASISHARVVANAQRLTELGPGTTDENAMTDARAGTLLSAMGELYFARNDGINRLLAEGLGVRQQRQLSGAVTATSLYTDYLMSFPVAMGFIGLSIDVDQDVQSVVSRIGDERDVREYLGQSGIHASYSEGRGFEGALGGSGVSTAHVFGEAARQGIPIQAIGAANVDQALETVDAPSFVEREIRNAVATGQIASIPRRGVRIRAFRGTAYTLEDPETGAAAYRLSTGTNGGSIREMWEKTNEENLQAMTQNIQMLKDWTQASGNGMVLQGHEIFSPSAPDGEYCNVYVDKQEKFVETAIELLEDMEGFTSANPSRAFGIAKGGAGKAKFMLKYEKYLKMLIGDHDWRQLADPVKLARMGQLYAFLYAQSRQIAFACIPLG